MASDHDSGLRAISFVSGNHPPNRLQAAIGQASNPINTDAGIADVAHQLNVSRGALVEHLGNLGLIGEDDRYELRLDA